jgi:hypothetical protein
MQQSPQRDPIRTHQRRTLAARRFGENAQCACGEARPEALISGRRLILCVQCQRKNKGQNIMDKHHVAGRANSPTTIAVPANNHRAILSVDQQDWPKETLENPDGLDLLKAAASIRGFIDTHDYLINQLLRPLPELLEKLADLERRGRTEN